MIVRPPGCRCLSFADSVRAEFAGASVLPCPKHDPDGFGRHVGDIVDEVRGDVARARARRRSEERDATDPILAELERKVSGARLPLNATADEFVARLGWGRSVAELDDDGPDAA